MAISTMGIDVGSTASKCVILRDGAVTRRRRECCACGFRYTTYDEIVRDDVTVVKKDGSRQLFDRAKVVNSIRRACGKRAPDEDQIGRMIDRVPNKGEENSCRTAWSRASKAPRSGPTRSRSTSWTSFMRPTRSRTSGSRASTSASPTSPSSLRR